MEAVKKHEEVSKVTMKVSKSSANGSKVSMKISNLVWRGSKKDMEAWKKRMETWVNNMDVPKLGGLDWNELEAIENEFDIIDQDGSDSEVRVEELGAKEY